METQLLSQCVSRPYFPGFGKGLGDSAVASSVAGGDEVSNAAALQERGRGHGAGVFGEEFGEGDHLHQTQTDRSGS